MCRLKIPRCARDDIALGMVDDADTAVAQGFDRVAHIGRYDGDKTRTDDFCNAVDGDFRLAVDDLVDLSLGMEVFVDRRPLVELVVGEGHVVRVEVAPAPAGQTLYDPERVCVDHRHRTP